MRAWARLSSSSRARWVAAGLLTAVALASVWHAAAPTWRKLDADHEDVRGLLRHRAPPGRERERGLRRDALGHVGSYVHGNDRIYFQAPHRPYGTLDLHDTVAALGRWYLAPATEVTDPADATVVLSYEADPASCAPTGCCSGSSATASIFSRVRSP